MSNKTNLPIFNKVHSFIEAEEIRSLGLYPYFRPISTSQSTEVILKNSNKKVLMFGSNSYLGLTDHPEIKKAAIAAIEKYGTGCAGSRFLNGTLDIHIELEEELADLVGKEAALLYSTGFQSNLGTIAALVARNEYVIIDKFDHASIVDGCLLSLGKSLRFKHNDMDCLQKVLSTLSLESGKLIVVDGVFSMEGDIAYLDKIVKLAEEYKAAVMVDDAHALGVLGKNGSGTSDHFGLTDKVPIIMGTFSKSLASLGGFIASDKLTIDYLKHHSRALIFSASISPANTAAVMAAIKIMKNEPERIEKLWHNTKRLLNGLKELGFNTGRCETPIIPVKVLETFTCFKIAKILEERGVFVNPVVPPAVPPNESLIRFSLMATHTDEQIDIVLSHMEKIGHEFNII
ncbi:MAG: aminotransferase class I/II-fold pyridoxal phosphate-dependent enzyme [bacterium]